MNLPNCKRPCADCPFRRDSLKGWLGADRAAEIAASGSFVCHKTAYTGDDDDRLQCAGHMLMMGQQNDFVQLAERLGINLELSGIEKVFSTADEFIKHHSK